MATTPMSGERFDVGRVAALTFGVIGRHPLLFVGVALLFSGLPALALASPYIIGAINPTERSGFAALWALVPPFFTYFILNSLMQALLVVATLQDLSGQRVDLAACFKRALILFVPLVALSLLLALAIGFGLILLIVPGVIAYVTWFVAVPALVEERRGVFAAFGRSARLTKGARGRIFGLVVAFIVVSLLISGASGLITTLSLGSFAGPIIEALTTMLTSLIASTGVAATYVELRTVKEGANVDALAAIFA